MTTNCNFFSGYANEVGEAFRALVHVNVVRFSYVVASTYVCADAVDKGKKAASVCTMNFRELSTTLHVHMPQM